MSYSRGEIERNRDVGWGQRKKHKTGKREGGKERGGREGEREVTKLIKGWVLTKKDRADK